MTTTGGSVTATTEYEVALLPESSPTARAKLDRLVSDEHYEAIDRLDSITHELDHVDVWSDVRWAVIPWRRAVVRLPGPDAYRQLRTDRNRNKLTAVEQQALGSKTIVVVGLSVGHVIAHTLAVEGIGGQLRLADGDVLEVTNLNRIPGSVVDLGLNKAILAARRILELDPYIDLVVNPGGLNDEDIERFIAGSDLVVEECDSFDMKLAVRAAARRLRIPVVMHTSDHGLLDVERFDLEPDRPLLHGLLGSLSPAEVAELTTEEKVPYMLDVLDPARLSARLGASLVEIDHLVSTWPQLAEDVVLGAASVTAVARRILLGEPVPSGRSRVDLDDDPQPVARTTPAGSSADAGDHQAGGRPESSLGRRLAVAAGRAPSGGNVQPWRFALSTDRFGVVLDPSKTSGMDVAWRGSQLAVGAALLNAEVAASAEGVLGSTSIAGTGSSMAGWVHYGQGSDDSYEDLVDHIDVRITNRSPASPQPLPAELAAIVERWTARFGASARLISERSACREIGELLGAADRLRYLTPRLHAEMMAELRWRGEDSRTGITVESLCLPPSDEAILEMIRRPDVMAELRSWDGGHALAELAPSMIDEASGVLVLCAKGTDGTGGAPLQPGTDGRAMVNAGRALQAIWLEVTALGLGLHPVSPLFLYVDEPADCLGLVDVEQADEVWSLSRRFRELVGLVPGEQPALILRVTHPSAWLGPTERMSIDHILIDS